MRNRPRVWTVLVLLILAVALRVLGLDRSLWLDESGSLAQASAPDFWAAAVQDVHPPLYYALLRAQLAVTSSVGWLRLFPVVCGVGTVVVIVRMLRGSVAGMVAAGAIVAALPEFVLHSQQLRPYALLFFLFSVALALAVGAFSGEEPSVRRKILLAFVLLLAAATHLMTAFFLLALVPLLAWPARRKGFWALAGTTVPLGPALLLLVWLKFGFVSEPRDLSGGWWMPPASFGVVFSALRSAAGWDEIYWLSDACARRLPGGGVAVQTLAIAAALFAGWAVWGRLRAQPLALALLAASFVYLAALVLYSCLFEPIVMARTVLPAVLPLAASLGYAIAADPLRWRRNAALLCMGAYLLFSIVPPVRRAFAPMAGLRGLALTAQTEYRKGDAVVLFRAMDFGLNPYWPGFSASDPLVLDQTKPSTPLLVELRRRLAALSPGSRVLVIYRHDFYLEKYRSVLDAATAELAASGRTVRVRWHENDLTLLLAEPTGNP